VTTYPTIALPPNRDIPIEEVRQQMTAFYEHMNRRRTVREFSSRSVPRDIIETALRAANTAPSGANLQPWHFVVISGPDILPATNPTGGTFAFDTIAVLPGVSGGVIEFDVTLAALEGETVTNEAQLLST